VLYARQQAAEINRFLGDPIAKDRLLVFVSRDAQKYLFIRKSALGLQFGDGDKTTITQDLRGLFTGLDQPAKEDTTDFYSESAMSLFNITRLNECFASPNLNRSDLESVLRGTMIRQGLPDNCVFPSTRALIKADFRKEFIEDPSGRYSVKKLIEAVQHPNGKAVRLVNAIADMKGQKTHLTLTRATAQLLTNAINALGATERALDDLFPLVPENELGTKVGPGYFPVGPEDGNII
jgi:hypothetical protein